MCSRDFEPAGSSSSLGEHLRGHRMREGEVRSPSSLGRRDALRRLAPRARAGNSTYGHKRLHEGPRVRHTEAGDYSAHLKEMMRMIMMMNAIAPPMAPKISFFFWMLLCSCLDCWSAWAPLAV